jgi:diadenylate cyclase
VPSLRLFWDTLRSSISAFSVLDVVVVGVAVYYLMLLLRGTRGYQLLKGVAVLLVLLSLTKVLGLAALHWLLAQALLPGVIALVILFQPELRLALARLGRGGLWTPALTTMKGEDIARIVEQVVAGAQHCSREHVGALMVLERQVALDEIVAGGKPLDALVSAELLRAVFSPASRLHDGAAVIRGERVVAAGCWLPLTERDDVGAWLGSRHRAALGLSETTDAAVVVVSERTGAVSLTQQGRLHANLSGEELAGRLMTILQAPQVQPASWLRRRARAPAQP